MLSKRCSSSFSFSRSPASVCLLSDHHHHHHLCRTTATTFSPSSSSPFSAPLSQLLSLIHLGGRLIAKKTSIVSFLFFPKIKPTRLHGAPLEPELVRGGSRGSPLALRSPNGRGKNFESLRKLQRLQKSQKFAEIADKVRRRTRVLLALNCSSRVALSQ